MKDKKSLKIIPDCIDSAVSNITDKPSKNIGDTLADIWYLVFGGISHAAEKRKIKYAHDIENFEKQLQEEIEKIPKSKRIQPDMQIVAPALEAAKYCVDKETLRALFSKLISSSLNSDTSQYVHPIFIDIVKSMSEFDAKVFLVILADKDFHGVKAPDPLSSNAEDLSFSLAALEKLGLIRYIDNENKVVSSISPVDLALYITEKHMKAESYHNGRLSFIQITQLGIIFARACIPDY